MGRGASGRGSLCAKTRRVRLHGALRRWAIERFTSLPTLIPSTLVVPYLGDLSSHHSHPWSPSFPWKHLARFTPDGLVLMYPKTYVSPTNDKEPFLVLAPPLGLLSLC